MKILVVGDPHGALGKVKKREKGIEEKLRRLNSRRHHQDFEIHDLVKITSPDQKIRQGGKLAPTWEGPFPICGLGPSPGVYQIMRRGKIVNLHERRLLPWVQVPRDPVPAAVERG